MSRQIMADIQRTALSAAFSAEQLIRNQVHAKSVPGEQGYLEGLHVLVLESAVMPQAASPLPQAFLLFRSALHRPPFSHIPPRALAACELLIHPRSCPPLPTPTHAPSLFAVHTTEVPISSATNVAPSVALVPDSSPRQTSTATTIPQIPSVISLSSSEPRAENYQSSFGRGEGTIKRKLDAMEEEEQPANTSRSEPSRITTTSGLPTNNSTSLPSSALAASSAPVFSVTAFSAPSAPPSLSPSLSSLSPFSSPPASDTSSIFPSQQQQQQQTPAATATAKGALPSPFAALQAKPSPQQQEEKEEEDKTDGQHHHQQQEEEDMIALADIVLDAPDSSEDDDDSSAEDEEDERTELP